MKNKKRLIPFVISEVYGSNNINHKLHYALTYTRASVFARSYFHNINIHVEHVDNYKASFVLTLSEVADTKNV